ncbi:MAG: RluA family pseudouridine synthase, partial [Coriobacteriia bacterium]|nr:RluA family pseudouridine synthase [Coriobacteriia bacterium]
MSETYEHLVSAEEAGQRLDKLMAEFDFLPSRSLAAKLIEKGCVFVDGGPASKRYAVRAGDRIEIFMPEREPSTLTPEHIPLDIRFEDEHLIVLSKPDDMVVHPAHGHWSGTLVHALLAHSPDLG